MFDLTKDELDCLRICRRHVNYRYEFPVSCIPSQYLNTVRIALIERGYIRKASAAVYEITKKGREALHQAALAAERAEQLAKHAAEQQAQEHAAKCADIASDRAHAIREKKKDYRHDFAVAAFGSAVALFLEHIGDVIDFIKVSVEKILTLLGTLH